MVEPTLSICIWEQLTITRRAFGATGYLQYNEDSWRFVDAESIDLPWIPLAGCYYQTYTYFYSLSSLLSRLIQ